MKRSKNDLIKRWNQVSKKSSKFFLKGYKFMKNIGLDFGTTNSAISYVDPKQKTLDCYRMRNADSNYIPSFVGFEKEDSTIEIGRSARLTIFY